MSSLPFLAPWARSYQHFFRRHYLAEKTHIRGKGYQRIVRATIIGKSEQSKRNFLLTFPKKLVLIHSDLVFLNLRAQKSTVLKKSQPWCIYPLSPLIGPVVRFSRKTNIAFYRKNFVKAHLRDAALTITLSKWLPFVILAFHLKRKR